MTDVGLLTPGLSGPAGYRCDDVAVLRAMLRAETAWVEAQTTLRLLPPQTHDAVLRAAETLLGGEGRLTGPERGDTRRTDAGGPKGPDAGGPKGQGAGGRDRSPAGGDRTAVALAAALAEESAATGNPVMPLVTRLREALPAGAPHGTTAAVHTGLTSQDVVDTALMLVVTGAVAQIRDDLGRAHAALGTLASEHRSTPVLARTLAQPAVPTTFGARAATWLQGLAEADTSLARLDHPVAWGGAAGTLDRATGTARTRLDTVDVWAGCLGLSVPAAPWHVTRFPVLRAGAALAEVCAALGKIAADVLTGVREGELSEPPAPGRGTSSTMAHKRNPVLSLLLRRSAVVAPGALQTLHTAAGFAVDERPDGAWHAEWPALRDLARHALGGAALAAELLEGISLDAEAAAGNLAAGLGGDAGRGASSGERPGGMTSDGTTAASDGWDTGVAEEIVDRVLAHYSARPGAPGGTSERRRHRS